MGPIKGRRRRGRKSLISALSGEASATRCRLWRRVRGMAVEGRGCAVGAAFMSGKCEGSALFAVLAASVGLI